MSTKAVANSYIKKKLWRIADDMHGADTDQPLLPTTDLQKYKTMLSIFRKDRVPYEKLLESPSFSCRFEILT
jgi:hypothetical protein